MEVGRKIDQANREMFNGHETYYNIVNQET